MDKKRIWGWYFFDWASQPYHTGLLTFVFGPFFATIAALHFAGLGLDEQAADARAQSMWSFGLTIAGLIVGFGAPFLGAFTDSRGKRVPWVAAFSVIYVVCAFALWWTEPDGSNLVFALAVFGVGFVAAEYALIFTNSQLPGLASEEEMGRLSGTGFAFGYLGGFFALLIALGLLVEQSTGKTVFGLPPGFGLLDPDRAEGARAVGPLVAIWFAVFMVPYFLYLRDTPTKNQASSFSGALSKVVASVRSLPQKPSLFGFLGGSMLYRDALNGLYAFGGTYAALALNWEVTKVGGFGIILVISAAILTWVGGKLDARFGPKPIIISAILGLIVVCILIAGIEPGQFFGASVGATLPDLLYLFCGIMIGGLGGSLQAASRTLMVRHTVPGEETEGFGLYGLAGRATSFLGTASVGFVTFVTGDVRFAVVPLIVLFLLGLLMLRWVNPEGDRDIT